MQFRNVPESFNDVATVTTDHGLAVEDIAKNIDPLGLIPSQLFSNEPDELATVSVEEEGLAVEGDGLGLVEDVICVRKVIQVMETDAEKGGSLLYDFLEGRRSIE